MEPFDALAEQYQAAHSTNPTQNRLIGRVAELLSPGSRVLDLGCGTGVPTARMLVDAGHSVLGVDVASKMLQIARQQVPEATFVQADMRELVFEPGEFGGATAFFSLLMLSRAEIERVLEQLRSALAPGGVLAIGMVGLEGDSMPVEFMGVRFTVSGYSEGDFRQVLESAGYEVLELAPVMFTPVEQPEEPQLFALVRSP